MNTKPNDTPLQFEILVLSKDKNNERECYDWQPFGGQKILEIIDKINSKVVFEDPESKEILEDLGFEDTKELCCEWKASQIGLYDFKPLGLKGVKPLFSGLILIDVLLLRDWKIMMIDPSGKNLDHNDHLSCALLHAFKNNFVKGCLVDKSNNMASLNKDVVKFMFTNFNIKAVATSDIILTDILIRKLVGLFNDLRRKDSNVADLISRSIRSRDE